jgi:hypothetical protein
VDDLANKVASFDGDATRVRCFVHVMNLVVKSVLVQFDVPTMELEVMAPGAAGSNVTSADGNNSDAHTQPLTQLCQLTKGLADEMQSEIEEVPLEDRQQDDGDGWIDEWRGMSEGDLRLLVRDVMPVRRMLVKVCGCLCVHVGPLWMHSLTLGVTTLGCYA